MSAKDLVDKGMQEIEGRLNGVPAIDRDVAMKDFLKSLGIRHEAFSSSREACDHLLGVGFVGMFGANDVHRHVGVDEDHRRLGPSVK